MTTYSTGPMLAMLPPARRPRLRTATYLELPADRIEACLRYYADYGDEIDEWIDRARAIAEREEARWHRRGEALA